MHKREADAQLDENDKLSIVMLNTQDAILDAIWNEDIEGFPDKFRDENLKNEEIVLNLQPAPTTTTTTTKSSTTTPKVTEPPTTTSTVATTSTTVPVAATTVKVTTTTQAATTSTTSKTTVLVTESVEIENNDENKNETVGIIDNADYYEDNENVTTQRVEKTKVPVTEAPANEYNDDDYEEMDISNGSETTTVESLIETTPSGEIDVNSNGTGSFDYEAPVFDDTETVENTTAIVFDGGEVDTTTIKSTTTTTTTTTEKPVASTKKTTTEKPKEKKFQN